jgi:hypothetical protein
METTKQDVTTAATLSIITGGLVAFFTFFDHTHFFSQQTSIWESLKWGAIVAAIMALYLLAENEFVRYLQRRQKVPKCLSRHR